MPKLVCVTCETFIRKLFVDNVDPGELQEDEAVLWRKWHREFYPENY